MYLKHESKFTHTTLLLATHKQYAVFINPFGKINKEHIYYMSFK